MTIQTLAKLVLDLGNTPFKSLGGQLACTLSILLVVPEAQENCLSDSSRMFGGVGAVELVLGGSKTRNVPSDLRLFQ